MSDEVEGLISDDTARSVVRMGMVALGVGLIFWLAVLAGIIYLIVHYV